MKDLTNIDALEVRLIARYQSSVVCRIVVVLELIIK